jgi:signal transduction histidine kinase
MKVLIVDDRHENRLILETKMKAAGYETATAANGAEALQHLQEEVVGLVITDLMMPEMDGFQLTHAIKSNERLKGIPILVYTATYTEPQDEALALNLGASRFLVKPASNEEFFAAVRDILGRAARGELPAREPTYEELTYLREYSQRLIRKLEDKVRDYEEADRKLRELNANLERRIEEATRELRQANTDLEAFTYSVSHDLRAPLRSIFGFLNAVRTNDPPLTEEEKATFLERAEMLAVHGQTLIGDLLAYAHLKSADLSLERVPLAPVVEKAIAQLGPAERRDAEITAGELAAAVLAHETTLVQVLHNLIANAVKFTAPGEPARVRIEEAVQGDAVRVSVRDRGIGIPPEHFARIFQVFERLHDNRTYEGTGVGLAIVQRGVTKMGGRVGVESMPGEGSTFWVELPKAPAT